MSWILWPRRMLLLLRTQKAQKRFLQISISFQEQLDIKEKEVRGRKTPLRVGFFVYNDSVFQLRRVFELMQRDSAFEPFIVVSSGIRLDSVAERNQQETHRRALENLTRKYPGYVFDSFKDGEYIDFSGKCDLVACMNPYDEYLEEHSRISYLAQHGALVFFSHYGFDGGVVWDHNYLKMASFGYLWRFYSGTSDMRETLHRYQPGLKIHNRVVLSGNPKIEPLAEQRVVARRRKKVIICPHHTIDPAEKFHLSNFVRFADFFLTLPERYPQIDWVFRPHPILMPKMVQKGFWTELQLKEYIAKMKSFPNMEYQEGGDYYPLFVNSDAMIQDCCAFLAEYLVTGHPQCYLLKSERHAMTQYEGLGLEMLDHVYKGYNEDDILAFIDRVVLAGIDDQHSNRQSFVDAKLKINYPNVSQWIVDDIKKSLNRK